MLQKKVNPVIQWWVTPKLPYHDVFKLPLLKNKNVFSVFGHIVSRWLVHPVKRRLARIYLKLLKRFTDIKVVGVTGSAGKSTTVRMIDSILKLKGRTVSTPPSIDSIYNIPNTILRCLPGTKFLVLEMSVEYPGEMDFYLWLAKPDIGVITNIFPAHTAFLGDINGVLKEKGKLISGLSENGVAVLNSSDEKLVGLTKRTKMKVLWFEGRGNLLVQNSSAASKVAGILGVKGETIKRGLASYERPKHRLEVVRSKSGAVILDDSYNSNPGAMLATLHYFNKIAKGKKIAVLGDMLELGDLEESEHRRVGKEIAKSNFTTVIGVGKAIEFLLMEVNKGSKETKTYLFLEGMETLPVLSLLIDKNSYVLIKGSRSIGLDKVVDALV